jgi:tRNA/rRNA methyltransferase
MAFWTYILRCADHSYYTGRSDDLDAHIAGHHAGTVPGYTHTRRPIELMWSHAFPTLEQAIAAQRQVKNWSRARKEALIGGDPATVAQLTNAPARRVSGQEQTGTDERTAAAKQPIIVLVRSQMGENIGKAARAMLNFGLVELRLVAPRDGWPNPVAGRTAAGADIVLEHATVYETVAEAVADCAHVYATTVRKRGVTKPVVTPEQAAREIIIAPGRSAILFGPERSGLETDDVALARAILTVPINPEFASLNLAQAVILCAYEWSKHVGASGELVQPTLEEILPPAPQEEFEGMFGQLATMLEPRGYFSPPSRATATRRTLRTILTKPGWNTLEVRTLRGVLSALMRKPGPRESRD